MLRTPFISKVILFLLCSGGYLAFSQCDMLEQRLSFEVQKVQREQALKIFADSLNVRLSFPSGSLGDDLISMKYSKKRGADILKNILAEYPLSYSCVSNNALVIFEQEKINYGLAGIIRDSETGSPVNGALVVCESVWVESDQDGFFLLPMTKSPANVVVYHPGYDAKYEQVKDDGGQDQGDIKIWYLQPNSQLTEAVINVFDSILFVGKAGGVNINMGEVERIPSISGSPGILNSLRFIPGFQSTLEVNGGMVVRGGSRDQNLVLLDGMELYNPMHLFGLFSIFGRGSIHSVEFYKGAFPAKYGGRLSSVLDVTGKQGDYNKWNSTLNFNPVLFEASLSGPINKGKTSVMVSGRRSFTDFFPLFYEQIQNQNQLSRFKYYFYDITGTINHRFSERSHLYLTNYVGGDKGYIRGKNQPQGNTLISELNNDEFLQSNLLSTLGFKAWLSKSFHLHTRVGYTRYKFSHKNNYDLSIDDPEGPYERITRLNSESLIEDWKAGAYLRSENNPKSRYQFGIENVWHSIIPSRLSYYLQENEYIPYDTTFEEHKSQIAEQRIFIQHQLNLNRLRVSSGVHFANFDNEVSYHALQPRLSISWDPKGKYKLEAGVARTAQFILSVPNNLLGIPIDVWVPADSTILPQYCWNFSGGISRKLSKNVIARIDGYYKKFENIVEFRSGVVDFVAEWDKALYNGKGRSKGLEFLIKKEKGKINGWIGYTLSKSERSVSEINGGEWFPFQFDRRHDFNLVFNYQPNENLVFGCTWTYASGHYLTAPETQFLINAEGRRYLIQQYGTKNNLKLPAYHRLDAGIHYHKEIGKARQTWSFTVYNLYNRQNVYYVNSSVSANGKVAFQPISILPILPSVNYAIHF